MKVDLTTVEGDVATATLVQPDEFLEAAVLQLQDQLEAICVKDPIVLLEKIIADWEADDIRKGISTAGDQKY